MFFVERDKKVITVQLYEHDYIRRRYDLFFKVGEEYVSSNSHTWAWTDTGKEYPIDSKNPPILSKIADIDQLDENDGVEVNYIYNEAEAMGLLEWVDDDTVKIVVCSLRKYEGWHDNDEITHSNRWAVYDPNRVRYIRDILVDNFDKDLVK